VCLAVTLVGACSDDSGTTSDGPVITDGPLSPDGGGGGDSIIVPDGPEPDASGPAAALQSVVDTLTFPKNQNEYSVDLDGDGDKDNRIGEINAILIPAGIDLQQEIDSVLKSAALIILFELFAQSLTDDPKATLQYHEGSKLPVVNTYAITINSPPNIVLDSKITGGKLEGGPGEFIIPLPLDNPPINVTIKKTQLKADVSSSGMANGQINGAIPWDDVDQKLIPAIASMANAALPTQPLLKLLDTNGDGTITADDIRNSSLLKDILAPDVDLDGNGKDDDKPADGLSVGVAFTAASCTIQR
jgi:hypothetical protein